VGVVARDAIALETRLGDLEVGIPEGTAAGLDVHARAGRVINRLEPGQAPGDAAPKRSRSGAARRRATS
jgi:hypothetical protein